MTVGTTFHVRPYTAADEPAVLGLLEAALQGGPVGRRTPDFFRWKHEHNPFGRSFRIVAENAGEIIGFRSFLRWQFTDGARTVRAVRAVDTATHPDHQGQGVFRRLTLDALDELRSETDLVFNTPNGRSGPGYLKMGWSRVGTVPLSIRPVRPFVLARHWRRARTGRGGPSSGSPLCGLPPAEEVLQDGASVTELLETVTNSSRTLSTARTAPYLRWRYADAPDLDYRAVTLYNGRALVGLAIGRPRFRGPLREFLLSEIFVASDDRTLARRLLHAVARSGCDHVVAHLPAGSTAARAAAAAGFLRAPGVGIGLMVNTLSSGNDAALDLSSWRFSLGDLELF